MKEREGGSVLGEKRKGEGERRVGKKCMLPPFTHAHAVLSSRVGVGVP